MNEYEEVITTIAIYIFIVMSFSLPFIVAYFSRKINRTLNKTNKLLDYARESEEEYRKYHE
jgi:hypothetical protein